MSFAKELAKKCLEIAALTMASEGTKALVQGVKAKIFLKYGLILIEEEDDEDDEEEDEEKGGVKRKETVSYKKKRTRRYRRKIR